MGKNKHDIVVRETAQAFEEELASHDGWEIRAHRIAGWPDPDPLPVCQQMVALHVPTTMVFSKAAILPSPDWKTPDVQLSTEHMHYYIDVCGGNESAVRIARKLEVVLNAAANRPPLVAGMALVVLPVPSAESIKPLLWERLVADFGLMFGCPASVAPLGLGQLDGWRMPPRPVVPFLSRLIESIGSAGLDESRVLEVVAEGNWREALLAHVKACTRFKATDHGLHVPA